MAAKKTKLTDFMPKQSETVLVQAKVKEELHKLVKAKLKSENYTIQELVNAAFEKYLTESPSE